MRAPTPPDFNGRIDAVGVHRYVIHRLVVLHSDRRLPSARGPRNSRVLSAGKVLSGRTIQPSNYRSPVARVLRQGRKSVSQRTWTRLLFPRALLWTLDGATYGFQSLSPSVTQAGLE